MSVEYGFAIYQDSVYTPKLVVVTDDVEEFKTLINLVRHVTGDFAKMIRNVTDEELNVSTYEIELQRDDSDDDGWFVNYALAVVEGKEVEVEDEHS